MNNTAGRIHHKIREVRQCRGANANTGSLEKAYSFVHYSVTMERKMQELKKEINNKFKINK